MQTRLGRAFGAGFALLLLLAGDDATAGTKPVRALSVDLPHGGCRLTILEDGQASIHYGAAPRRVRVAPGTFDFDAVALSLRSGSYPQGDGAVRSDSTGSVSLPDSQELRFVDDPVLVRSLLERAWRARAAPTQPFDSEENYRWVARACGFSD
ncbi:hypothetical protein H0E84_10510 [Luteimonas sp. SJ-92]|uniref:Uncharacterized protein n=1 Tax=Luteimonas salinisoli TaxID=2752307 RepID=A0A853JC38_9GAMM|nr:hypothetical protein [Luteimonas salinisoli]NZA26816.1 hypothetical protein [Luteimonas salinisoli]